MKSERKFTLLESEKLETRGRFILHEAEEDEAAAEKNTASEDEQDSDNQIISKKVADVKAKLLEIADSAEKAKEALAASVKPDGTTLADAAEAHEQVRAKAESVEKSLDGIAKRATDEANRFGELTAEELSMENTAAAFENSEEGISDDLAVIAGYFKSIEPDINDEASLDAAKSVCANIATALEAFSTKYTSVFENRQRRAIADKEKEAKANSDKAESESQAALNEIVPSTESLPSGIEEIIKGDAFKQELKAFGAKASMNPFLSFLKKMHDGNQSVWNKLNAGYYAIIHNAYVEKQLSKQDLASGKCALLACENAIAKPDFYSASYSDAAEYLELQDDLRLAVYYKKSVADAGALQAELGLDRSEASSNGTLFDAEVGQKVLYDDAGKLRPINEIERYIEAFLGNDAGKSGKILDTEPDEITKALANAIGCATDELKARKNDLAAAIRILTAQAYLRDAIQELDYEGSKKALKTIGADSDEIALDSASEDSDKKWIRLFNCGNSNYKKLLDSYLKTIVAIFKPAKSGGK